MAASYDGEGNKVFQMSRKLFDGGKDYDHSLKTGKDEKKTHKETDTYRKYSLFEIFTYGGYETSIHSSEGML